MKHTPVDHQDQAFAGQFWVIIDVNLQRLNLAPAGPSRAAIAVSPGA